MSSIQPKNKTLRFGEKIRKLRLEHKRTLKEFAASLGYSAHGYISEIEQGKKMPTVDFVLNVSRVYDVSIDVLLKDELELGSTKPETNEKH